MMSFTLPALILAWLNLAEAGLYQKVTGPRTGYEYAFYGGGGDTVDFYEADYRCPSHYYYQSLVYIKLADVQEEVVELIDSHGSGQIWIGMWDRRDEGRWTWLDGTDVGKYYTNWAVGEPNDKFQEDCGVIKHGDWKWNDDDCGYGRGFVCFTPSVKDEISVRDRHFMIRDFGNSPSTLEFARQQCESSGLRLAIIDSDDVVSKISSSEHWDESSGYLVEGRQACLNSESCLGLNKYVCEAVSPTTMRLSSNKNDYSVGDEIEVECSSVGYPAPKVTWHKYVSSMTNDAEQNAYQRMEPGKSTLVIKSATLEDTSRYRCFAKNQINGEEQRHKTYLDVRVHP